MRRSDIEELKAFVTRNQDTLRLPYARYPETVARRTVYFGTVNDSQFLVDTENRRYWVLDCASICEHQIDIRQFWAEVKTWYDAGEPWWLTNEEIEQLHVVNAAHRLDDPIEQMLALQVKHPKEGKPGEALGKRLNATGILRELGLTNPSKMQVNTAANWLKANGFNYWKKNKTFSVSIIQVVVSR